MGNVRLDMADRAPAALSDLDLLYLSTRKPRTPAPRHISLEKPTPRERKIAQLHARTLPPKTTELQRARETVARIANNTSRPKTDIAYARQRLAQLGYNGRS
jgi:hypothetical protein